jgi:spore coat assembly protein SafA
MDLSPMRYKNYIWPHNPTSYQISFARRIAALPLTSGGYVMQNLGLQYRIFHGEGEFIGADAYDQFRKLASLIYSKEAGLLVHPLWQPCYAYLVELELVQEPLPNYVRYRFVFWEAPAQSAEGLKKVEGGSARAERSETSYTVRQGDTLWAIAKAQGISLQALLEVNPQIRNPNRIYPGDKVVLP